MDEPQNRLRLHHSKLRVLKVNQKSLDLVNVILAYACFTCKPSTILSVHPTRVQEKEDEERGGVAVILQSAFVAMGFCVSRSFSISCTLFGKLCRLKLKLKFLHSWLCGVRNQRCSRPVVHHACCCCKHAAEVRARANVTYSQMHDIHY